MAASVTALGLFLGAAPAYGQPEPTFAPPTSASGGDPPSSGGTFHFQKPPHGPAPAEQPFHFREKTVATVTQAAWSTSAPVENARLTDAMAALQAPRKDPAPAGPKSTSDESRQYKIPLELPAPREAFQLDTEAELQERMRQQARSTSQDNRIGFPDEPVVSRERFMPRALPPATERAEAAYVCHRRLLFQEINAERYGWDLGALQPFVSAGTFYLNLATVPYHLFTRPCQKYECSAGYCLPGDPVPYLLYPPELSLTGTLAEASAVVGVLAIFP